MCGISENTKAILLLCANWGKSADAARPLSPGEFNAFWEWLAAQCLEPANLVASKDAMARYCRQPLVGIEPARLEVLLRSGAGMSLQVEQWLNNSLWVLGMMDEEYPERLKTVLAKHAPPVIYGCGPAGLLSRGGIAVVGSRDVDDERAYLAEELSRAAAENGLSIISGGARGVDQISMHAALSSGGAVIGVLAGDLARAAVRGFFRESAEEGKAVLVSPYKPDAGFSVGNAMGRNKLIYALADVAVIVSASDGKGGTWTGAVENLDKWHVPMYVVDHPDLQGNSQLIRRGGLPLPSSAQDDPSTLIPAPARQGECQSPKVDNPARTPVQLPLFDPESDEQ
jgi:predicted Rossmann fold nucleotide-binding protein DprA/Smf involved in DNA uptake